MQLPFQSDNDELEFYRDMILRFIDGKSTWLLESRNLSSCSTQVMLPTREAILALICSSFSAVTWPSALRLQRLWYDT